MEKDNFLDKLGKLVELAKTKQNALDVTEINNFFMGEELTTEQMDQIYTYLENRGVDVIPVIDDSVLTDDVLMSDDLLLDDDLDDGFIKEEKSGW